MKIKSSSTLLGAALGLALLSAPAHGAITVLDSATGLNNAWTGTGPASLTFTGLDLTGGSKLVVSIGTQATASGTDWTSVTFDSVGMTEAARLRNGNNIQSGIYYLDNLTGLSASGNLTIAADNLLSRGITATAWVLSGTAAGVGNSGATVGASTTLTTTAANSWVLAATTLASTTVPIAQSPLTDGLGLTNPYSGSNETSISTGYQTVATSGTNLTPTFDSGASTAAAEFSVIPEPSSTAFLGGLGLLALLRRRR